MKKRRRSPGPSPHGDSGTENEMMSFSRSEVEKMIDEAVISTGIDREERYEVALYKLEDHIKKVKRRGEAAFAYIRKLGISSAQVKQDKSELPSPAVAAKLGNCSRPDSEDQTMNMDLIDKHGKSIPVDDKGAILKKMVNIQNSVHAMQVDAEAMKTIIRKVKEEPLSPTKESPIYHTPHSLQSKVGSSSNWIKKEKMSPGHSPTHEKMQVEDEERKTLKNQVQQHPVSEDPDSHVDECSYPPFPPTPFPLEFDIEAASYNIPQAPTIQLARIKHPPGLSVLWNMEKDPSAPPMDLYSVYMTVEDAKGSGVFKEWKSLGEVKARELPMCVLVNKYRPEYKVCFTVVGKDTFGRYGNYSKVATATPPAP